jgi:hypothetical protein
VPLQVYPNPVSASCTITLPPDFNQQNNGFTVYTSTGAPVKAPVTIIGYQATINLENLPSGFYLVRLVINSDHTVYQARIIKK